MQDGEVALRPDLADDNEIRFAVEWAGVAAGSVTLWRTQEAGARVEWDLADAEPEVAVQALRLLVRHAFHRLRLARVEAYVSPDDVAALRLASRAGLRREGVVRGRAAEGLGRADAVLLGRLADDPAPHTADGFRAMLNATLPTKRVIAQGVLRDPLGRVLLCELVYKSDWDLPGGVVEPGESPRDAVVREVHEELGLAVTVTGLLVIDWLPPWAGWDDALVLVFDLGAVDAGWVDDAVLEPREIAAVHWCDPALVRERARPPTTTRVEQALTAEAAVFLHGGQSRR